MAETQKTHEKLTNDTIYLSPSSTKGINHLLDWDEGLIIQPENAAWAICMLKHAEDTIDNFPHGKWATIQYIQGQLDVIGKLRLEEIQHQENIS